MGKAQTVLEEPRKAPISYPEQCLFEGGDWHWPWGNRILRVLQLVKH